jgi:hypothetical protein
LHSFGRLRRRLDRLTEIQEAFLRLACALIGLRYLQALTQPAGTAFACRK